MPVLSPLPGFILLTLHHELNNSNIYYNINHYALVILFFYNFSNVFKNNLTNILYITQFCGGTLI